MKHKDIAKVVSINCIIYVFSNVRYDIASVNRFYNTISDIISQYEIRIWQTYV